MRYGFLAWLTLYIALAGCSRATAPAPLLPPAAEAIPDAAASYDAIYSFKVQNDGHYPEASLIVQNGTLFGTTLSGGSDNYGTVFRVTPSGTEKVLHSFKPVGGVEPEAPLLNVNGTLYGTTFLGGAKNQGTVFHLNPDGSGFKTIWNFKGGAGDGASPLTGLVLMNGVLYGTTSGGGGANDGVVYSITPQGAEHILYSFSGPDGRDPRRLTVRNGALFGTADTGGANNKGIVFRLNLSGKETVLYNFRGSDGAYPYGGVTFVNGTMYGTTIFGGAHDAGTLFKLTLAGQETVLYSFRGGTKACSPAEALTVVQGVLYGTTSGENTRCLSSYGTIFKITTGGVETTLHVFGKGPGGGDPQAGLTVLNGKLYGTTSAFGSYHKGVVYSSGE